MLVPSSSIFPRSHFPRFLLLPQIQLSKVPTQYKLWAFATSPLCENTVFLGIILNTVSLAMKVSKHQEYQNHHFSTGLRSARVVHWPLGLHQSVLHILLCWRVHAQIWSFPLQELFLGSLERLRLLHCRRLSHRSGLRTACTRLRGRSEIWKIFWSLLLEILIACE